MTAKQPSRAEEQAFRELYERYKDRLFGFVLKMVTDPELATEMTQEIFVKLWLSRDRLRQVRNMDSYLFTTAKNQTLNYFRKAATHAEALQRLQSAMQAADNNVAIHMARTEHDRLMAEALQQLSAQRRRVFVLSRYEGLDMEEIAEKLQLSKNTIKNHLVTSLRLVRAYLINNGALLPLIGLMVWLLR